MSLIGQWDFCFGLTLILRVLKWQQWNCGRMSGFLFSSLHVPPQYAVVLEQHGDLRNYRFLLRLPYISLWQSLYTNFWSVNIWTHMTERNCENCQNNWAKAAVIFLFKECDFLTRKKTPNKIPRITHSTTSPLPPYFSVWYSNSCIISLLSCRCITVHADASVCNLVYACLKSSISSSPSQNDCSYRINSVNFIWFWRNHCFWTLLSGELL